MREETKIFLANFFHLSFLKAISRVLPLITTPFLIRVIGIEKFGMLEFAKAISFYFTAFVSFGFKYSATKQVTLHKQDKTTIGEIVSSVYAIKLVIIVICFFIMLALIFFVPKIREERIYLISFFPIVIASSLFPTFVFQGLDKMHWLTSLNVIFKVLFLLSLFVFIRQPEDAILFPVLLGVVDILRLGVALIILYTTLSIPVRWPVLSIMIEQIKEGLHIFLSQLAVMFYSRFSAIFLGLFGNSTLVAIYILGDRIARTTESMLEPAIQALYPIAYQKITTNINSGLAYIKYFAKITLFILGIIGIFYWYFADKIIALLAGSYMPEAALVFRLHAFLPAIIFLSNLLGIGILMPLQAGRKYTYSVLITGCLAVVLHFILVPKFQTQGAAWAILISEIFAVIFLFLFVHQEIKIGKLRTPANHVDNL
jgi:PST family polysaccharide transporter